MPSVLTIAGTDSSGGAGIGGDLKTITALGCYGALIVTALTAQNTTGVQAIYPCPPDFVTQQLHSVFDDIKIDAIKTGMLHNSACVAAVVKSLEELQTFGRTKGTTSLPYLVVDPVIVSTSGHVLLEADAIDLLCSQLLPLATLITPNIPEAQALLDRLKLPSEISDLPSMISAAKNLARLGCKAVLLKGGHQPHTLRDVLDMSPTSTNNSDPTLYWSSSSDPQGPEILKICGDSTRVGLDTRLVVDILHSSKRGSPPSTSLFIRLWIDSTSTHGTGCALSSAIACELAKGSLITQAVHRATEYTFQAIASATKIGQGTGPLNHLYPILSRTIPLATSQNPFPFMENIISSSPVLWQQYVQHPFIVQLGNGSLSRQSFVYFIKQDYHFLKHYARAYSLLAAKSQDITSISLNIQAVSHTLSEISLHESFCVDLGVSKAELDLTPESVITSGYANYLLGLGLRGDVQLLTLALMSCLLGYGEVGVRLKDISSRQEIDIKSENNIYQRWIEAYGSDAYQQTVKTGLVALEKLIALDPPSESKLQEMELIWKSGIQWEIKFWDVALNGVCSG